MGSMQEKVVVSFTPEETELLEDVLDRESDRMEKMRPGARPGKKEKLLNSVTQKMIDANARL